MFMCWFWVLFLNPVKVLQLCQASHLSFWIFSTCWHSSDCPICVWGILREELDYKDQGAGSKWTGEKGSELRAGCFGNATCGSSFIPLTDVFIPFSATQRDRNSLKLALRCSRRMNQNVYSQDTGAAWISSKKTYAGQHNLKDSCLNCTCICRVLITKQWAWINRITNALLVKVANPGSPGWAAYV